MPQYLPLRVSRTALPGIAAAIAVMIGAPAEPGTNNEQAITVCLQELADKLGATAVNDVEIRRRGNRRYVFGTADFSDAAGVQFRCRVYEGSIRSMNYLMPDPTSGRGTSWSRERPRGEATSDLGLDKGATSPAPPVSASGPVFKPAPQ